MARMLVSASVSVILIAALAALCPSAPAAAAEPKPGPESLSQPRPATPGMTVPAMAPDLAVTMAPQVTPYQMDGKSCVDFRPGTVVVTNVGNARAELVSVGIYLRLGDGDFNPNTLKGPVTLEPGKSVTMVLTDGSFSIGWCPGAPLVTWRAWADDAQKITEPNETNNIADRTYRPRAPRQQGPKTR